VGGTQPILCLGIGMFTQHGPAPVWAKTTLWHSHYFCGLASIAHLSREKSPNCLQLRTLLQPV